MSNDNLMMAPEIADGVNGVCTKVKRAIHDHRNTHGGGYGYTSVDTFYEDMGPLLAEAGLFIVMNEVEAASDGKWLTLTFAFYIYHKSGKAFGPVMRSQGVLANGPQAYAAAQSYAEKYFIRQLFKIPTGEKEADADSQKNEPIPASKKTAAKQDSKPEPDYSKERDLAIEALKMSETLSDLDKWGVVNKPEINRMPAKDQQAIRDAFAEHKKVLEQKKEAA